MNTHIAQRISDLEALAMEEGIELPYPPEMIARLEETGAIVDLITGAILPGEAFFISRRKGDREWMES